MVIVDTSVLSLAFRRRIPGSLSADENQRVEDLKGLALSQQAILIGSVRQEVLAGIRSVNQFLQLKTLLDGFVYLATEKIDHDAAAEYSNVCRAKGISADSVDILVCAIAIRHNASVLTADHDFSRYAKHIPIRLYSLPPAN